MRRQHKFLVFEKKVVHCRKMRQLKNASALARAPARDIQIILHLLHNKDYKGEMENLVGSRDINKVFENPSQSIIFCKQRSKLRFFSFEDI